MKKQLQQPSPSPMQIAAFLATRNRTTFHVFVSDNLQVKIGIGTRKEIQGWTFGSINQKHLIEAKELVPESVEAINRHWKMQPAYIKRAMGDFSPAERQKAVAQLRSRSRIGHVFDKLSDPARAELVNGLMERERILDARRAFKAGKKPRK